MKKLKKFKNGITALLLCTVILFSNLSPVFGAEPSPSTSGETMTQETGEEITEPEEPEQSATENKAEDSKESEENNPHGEDFNTPSLPDTTDNADISSSLPSTTENPETETESELPKEESDMTKEEVMDYIAGPEGTSFNVNTTTDIYHRSVNNGSKLPVNSVRFDKFYTPVGLGDYYNPQLAMGIKYIDKDNQTPDADGKWRYVYCLNFKKSSPTGQDMTYKGGWTNRKLAYCLYYGAMFWQKPCRYQKYSTGTWDLDYFVTQTAIHILNGEFSFATASPQIDAAANATATEKALVKDRINKLVNDANNSANYTSFTSDGWFDASANAKFSVTTPSNFASVTDGYATGYSSPTFKTAYDLDLKEQITNFTVTVPSGVTVQKKDSKTYSDFRLFIKTAQYKAWQLTGKTITTTVKATAPKLWGGGIYTAPDNSEYQDVVMWTYTSSGGSYTKTTSFDKTIPKSTYDLKITKKDAETNAALKGATFSLWSYDGTNYNKKLGIFKDNGDGSYTYTGVDYTTTKDGWFLIKEDKAPAGYFNEYILENPADRTNYTKYGGREIQLTADGFTFDGVPNGNVFKDPPQTPKANIEIMKVDATTGTFLKDAEFKVYEWDKATQDYKKDALQSLTFVPYLNKYRTLNPVVKTEENEGKFKIVETKLPDGYKCPWSKEITVTESGTQTLSFEAKNYHVRNLTINKKIHVDEIIWAHGNPTFLFKVEGQDINGNSHTYHRAIEFTKDYVDSHTENGFVTLGTTISNIPAGNYDVTEDTPVLRYILTDVTKQTDNITIEKSVIETINGFDKISAKVTANLTAMDGEVTYENHKTHFDKLSHNSTVINKIK